MSSTSAESTSPSAEPSGSGVVQGKNTAFVAGIIVTILLVVLLGANIEQLLLGWLYFLLYTIPKMTVDWPSAIVGTVCGLLVVVGLHRTARWLMISVSCENPEGTNRWTWRKLSG